MTDVTRMEAGRELDAIIAERIMGFARAPQPPDARGEHGGVEILLPPETPSIEAVTRGNSFALPPKGCIGLAYFAPRYSTDINAALLVVDRIARHRDRWMLTLKNWNYYGDRTWTAQLTSHPLGPAPVEERAVTIPHAICLAALTALTVEVPR